MFLYRPGMGGGHTEVPARGRSATHVGPGVDASVRSSQPARGMRGGQTEVPARCRLATPVGLKVGPRRHVKGITMRVVQAARPQTGDDKTAHHGRRSNPTVRATGTDAGEPTADGDDSTCRDTWGFAETAMQELWHKCARMVDGPDWHTLCQEGIVGDDQRMFPTISVQPAPLWDAAIYDDEELVAKVWSHPQAPAMDDSARLRHGFQLPYQQWAEFFDGHVHGPYLVNAAAVGMSVMCTMPAGVYQWRNPVFTDIETDAVDAWIDGQLSQGKIWDVTGSLSPTGGRAAPFVASPLSCAQKPGEAGAPPKVRVCGNMSAGGGDSINAHIEFGPHLEPAGLMSVESVARRVRYLLTEFPDATLYGIKIDLSQAFRNLQAGRREWWSMGMEWRGRKYAHTHVMWGSRSAMHLMALVTSAVCDILARQGIWVDVFCDDFVSVQPSKEAAEAAAAAIKAALASLGLVESVEKYQAPTQQLVVLGVLFNLVTGEITVTEQRRAKTIALLETFLVPDATFSERHVQQLAGRLFFMASVIPWSRPRVFSLWRWLAQWTPAGGSGYREQLPVPREVTMGLEWWYHALHGHESLRSLHLQAGVSTPVVLMTGLASDASDFGFGAIMAGQQWYIGGMWAPWEVNEWSINLRELLAVTFATAAFSPHLAGHIVHFRVDNTTAHYAMCNGGSNNIFMRFLVHVIVQLQEHYKFRMVTEWVDTTSIGPPDPLSRGQWPDGWLMASKSRPGKRQWTECPVPGPVRAVFGTALGPSWGSSQALKSYLQRHWSTGTSFDEYMRSGLYRGSKGSACPSSTAHLQIFT